MVASNRFKDRGESKSKSKSTSRLPPGWKVKHNEKHGRDYYYNRGLVRTVWTLAEVAVAQHEHEQAQGPKGQCLLLNEQEDEDEGSGGGDRDGALPGRETDSSTRPSVSLSTAARKIKQELGKLEASQV